LTHFSQRYQKVPVLERGDEEVEMVDAASAPIAGEDEEEDGGMLEDGTAQTFPDQPEGEESGGKQYDLPPKKAVAAPEAVRFKLRSDMKVCVAFDYMRVKVGDIGVMEKFTPALLKLFAEEEKEAVVVVEKPQKKGKEKKKGGK
jgi:ribonuclease Z